MKKIVKTAADAPGGIPQNKNMYEAYLSDMLTDAQKQALRMVPDSKGGDKLVSAAAVKKHKADLDKAKQKAISDAESNPGPEPLVSAIDQLNKFKAAFLAGKAGQGEVVDKQRAEAEAAKQKKSGQIYDEANALVEKVSSALRNGFVVKPSILMDIKVSITRLQQAISSKANPKDLKKAYDILYGLATEAGMTGEESIDDGTSYNSEPEGSKDEF